MSKQYNTKLQERLEKFLKDENLSQAKAAPILGISQAALSQYRRSMYDKGDIEAVENKLKEFFQIQEEKTQNAQKAEPFRTKTSAGYIPTTISEEAYKLIRYCQLEKGIVVIDGDAGIGFMFAQLFNKSMKYVGQARKEMGVRTVFNILGPLANPSRAKNMVVGVYDAALTEKIALAMSRLGVARAFVVSGKDNMDEITTTTETVISEIKDGKVNTFTITPEQFGLKRASLEELRGGDGTENAVITKKILSGEEKGAKRDIVLLNAGATLYVGGAASTIEDGITLAKEAIDSGKAAGKLAELVKVSNEA